MNLNIIHRDPEILGGTPVFRGTRVPIRAIFDYIDAEDSLDAFLDDFPSVQRSQALGILDISSQALVRREDEGYWAEIPALPGCVTQAQSLIELRENLKEAVQLWLESGDSLTFATKPTHTPSTVS